MSHIPRLAYHPDGSIWTNSGGTCNVRIALIAGGPSEIGQKIVRACNTRETLMKALQDLYCACDMSSVRLHPAMEQAGKALAMADNDPVGLREPMILGAVS